jgi:hypothetical protein
MVFQIQKEYKYLAFMVLLLFAGAFYLFQTHFYLIVGIFAFLIIAQKPYKVLFIEEEYIEIYRLLGKKRIELRNIQMVTKGTHQNAIIHSGGVIRLGHLIDRVDTLTNLIEKSIVPTEVNKIESQKSPSVMRSENPSSFELVKMAVIFSIVAIILTVFGVIFFLNLAKSL